MKVRKSGVIKNDIDDIRGAAPGVRFLKQRGPGLSGCPPDRASERISRRWHAARLLGRRRTATGRAHEHGAQHLPPGEQGIAVHVRHLLYRGQGLLKDHRGNIGDRARYSSSITFDVSTDTEKPFFAIEWQRSCGTPPKVFWTCCVRN